MLPRQQAIFDILNFYPIAWSLQTLESLGNHGGYSGAQLWKIQSREGITYCLRAWPKNPGQENHARWIQQELAKVTQAGFPAEILPLAKQTRNQDILIKQNGRIFELTRWMPGTADFWLKPTTQKTIAVATTLANFHKMYPKTHVSDIEGRKINGIAQRQQLIQSLNQGLFSRIETELPRLPCPDIGHTILQYFKVLEPQLSSALKKMSSHQFRQQTCIRDIWHDHVLFEENSVSGIVDFGAMGIDNPATDIARLFGSLFQNQANLWHLALESYLTTHELSDAELELIEVYDRSGTMLASVNWLKWILIENRKFDSFVPIKKRMELMVSRMSDWVQDVDPL